MGKEAGLGDHLFVDKYDISGDVGSVSKITGGPAEIDVTGIDKSARERIGGISDAEIDFNCFFNTSTGAHTALKGLPITDLLVSYFHGAAVGNAAACMEAKEATYDWNRTQAGALEGSVKMLSGITGNGVEWGKQLTAGKVTHASAATVASLDGTSSSAHGMTAYVHVFSVASGSVVPVIQDSADNVSFTAITDLTFPATNNSAAGGFRQKTTSQTATIRRYVRFATTGTFTNAVVAAAAIRYLWTPTL